MNKHKVSPRILPNNRTEDFEVHMGLIILYHGTLRQCEEYCWGRELVVGNRAEVNRHKYSNMPVSEFLDAVPLKKSA